MKVLKATLAFVMGLVLGIILLVLAIGGTVVALGTTKTVGELQSAVTNTTIISPDSELYGQTVLEAVQKALNDYQNFNNITLKLLYERYGINLFQGISGLDFTKKSFYDKPLTDIINDVSILLDDIYLSDIETLADLDFTQYNLPIVNENRNVGLSKAIDNIMKLVNDDLTIRTLKNKLNLDLGAEANGILSALQDVKLNSIGGLIDALRIGTLLSADTDTFLLKGVLPVYVSVQGASEEWEVVTEAQLKDPNYVPPIGVETYIAGGDEDGNLIEKELRFYKYEGKDEYVADNSCYNDGWTCPEGATVYRHRLYKPYAGNGAADGTYFVQGYANHVETFDNLAGTGKFTLLVKEFVSLDDIHIDENGAKINKTLVSNGKLDLSNAQIYYAQKAEEEGAPDVYQLSDGYSILDDEISASSLLRVPDEPTEDEEGNQVDPKHPYKAGRDIYLKSHGGTSSPLLQYLNYLSIGYIRNDTDEILKNVRIGDIIDTDDPNTADVLKALKDSTLDSIGEDINHIPFGDMFGESDNQLLNAIKDFTLDSIGDDMDTLTIGDIMDTKGNTLLEALAGSTLDSIGDDVNKLTIGQIIDLTEEGTPDLLIALDKRGCTLQNIGETIKELTVGELLEVEFDEYVEDDAGDYKRMDLFAEYNEFVDFEKTYGAGAVRGDYNEDTGEFTPNAESGTWVKTYYFALYEEKYDGDVQRYRLVREGDTALAVQSLARHGFKALEMGDHLNDLSIGELMRIEPDSAQMFKTLARRGEKLNDIPTAANKLTIGEIIEIDDDSSKIMKSLAARNCTLENMDNITDELTLSEILDIKYDTYQQADDGVYVHITDPKGYVIYDEAHPDDPEWRTKYVKVLVPGSEEDGTAKYEYTKYDPAKHEGMTIYVHSAYYTLYNPAVHTATNIDDGEITIEHVKDQPNVIARFKKIEYDPSEDPDGENEPSSKILQRFAGSTMGDFSTAFDEIMLSDVMDINADIYAAVDKDEIKFDKDKGYYYGAETFEEGKVLYKYDAENGVYTVANQRDLQQAASGSLTLYHVSISGDSPSILKKLAYVKVDNMADALDVVMKDMVLSEIIDIHVYDAVESIPDDFFDTKNGAELSSAEYNAPDKRYYIPWDGETTINGEPVVFVYEATGKYIIRNYYYRAITEANTQKYLGDPTTKYFKYVPYKLDSIASATTILQKIETGNVYIQKDASTYIYNVALATYYASTALKNLSISNLAEANAKLARLAYRVQCNSSDEGAIAYDAYYNIPAEYKDKKICIEVLGKKTKTVKEGDLTKEELNLYNPDDPFHSDLPKYVLLEDGENHIVPLNVPEYEYNEETDVKLGTQYARAVMVKQESLRAAKDAAAAYPYGKDDKWNCDKVYVFLPSTNSYEVYDENNEGHNIEGAQYYTRQIGYVAHFGEVFYETKKNVTCVTNLKFKEITVEREHSSKVLTLLANETINDMNGAIENATINDFMDVTPGTIFDEETIRTSTLNHLGSAIAETLSTMTIGRLLEWGSISTIDPQVRAILNDITLTDFFGALTYQDGTIVLDMEKLYDIEIQPTP